VCGGMLHLADRGSDGVALMRRAAATGAQLLWRIGSHRVLPVIEPLPDGSYLSVVSTTADRIRLGNWLRRRRGIPPQIHGVAVRVIEADVTVTDPAQGAARTSRLRLVTTLLDHQRYPAGELAALYHQRWEAETAYYGLKVTALGSRTVLRSHHPRDVFQELFAVLIVNVALREAAHTRFHVISGTSPPRSPRNSLPSSSVPNRSM
jgi:hypothetical protein